MYRLLREEAREPPSLRSCRMAVQALWPHRQFDPPASNRIALIVFVLKLLQYLPLGILAFFPFFFLTFVSFERILSHNLLVSPL